ncbi:uncharacterized protein METZ01_LOCUS509612, partial [marine metagenome]
VVKKKIFKTMAFKIDHYNRIKAFVNLLKIEVPLQLYKTITY